MGSIALTTTTKRCFVKTMRRLYPLIGLLVVVHGAYIPWFFSDVESLLSIEEILGTLEENVINHGLIKQRTFLSNNGNAVTTTTPPAPIDTTTTPPAPIDTTTTPLAPNDTTTTPPTPIDTTTRTPSPPASNATPLTTSVEFPHPPTG